MLTLSHLIASFVADTRIKVESGFMEEVTLDWYQAQFNKLEPLGHFPAEALRLHHLVSIKLSNAFVRALKRLYRWGADEEHVPKDPFAKLAVPPCGQRERTLSRDELVRLYRVCSPRLRRLLFVQCQTLARPGEIRNLTWSQVDWERRVLFLKEFKGKKRRKDKLKVRAIAIPVTVARMLRNMHRKSPDPAPTGRVFYATRGEPWTANGFRCAMRRARERCGLDCGDEPVVAYHLRHTGATEAVRRGENLKIVAELMGHTRTTTTERYTHLNTADVVAAIDRISSRPRPSRAG